MRRLALGAVLVGLACRATAGESLRTHLVPTPVATLFTRALQALPTFDYTVVDANREAGFIRAERQGTSSAELAFTGVREMWILTLTFVADSAGTKVVAQPTAVQERAFGQRNATGISDAQQQSVTKVLAQILATP